MLDLRDDPLVRRAVPLLAAAPCVALLRPSPHDLALVEGIEENRADARWRPRAMPPRAGPRRAGALGIQSHRDLLLSIAAGHHVEDPPHDRGFVVANFPDNVRSPAALIEHGDVPVPEDGTAGDVSALRLELERVASPLTPQEVARNRTLLAASRTARSAPRCGRSRCLPRCLRVRRAPKRRKYCYRLYIAWRPGLPDHYPYATNGRKSSKNPPTDTGPQSL